MRLGLALLAALCWIAATPPGWFPGAGMFIAPALAAFYALVTSSRRPFALAYVVGFAHLLALSWSLRNFAGAGIVAIGVVGAFYYAGVVLWLRALGRWLPRTVAFGLGIAFFNWLRTVQPELPYPHGQPAHCLYRWPVLLGSVAWGGEVLANAWLAAWSAALVDAWRAWRDGRPPWRRARRAVLAWSAGGALMIALPPPRAPIEPGAAPVTVLAIQPNLPAGFQSGADPWERIEQALAAPTRRLAGPLAAAPPDLVLWPESGFGAAVDARADPPQLVRQRVRVSLAPHTRLAAGAVGLFAQNRATPVAVLVDADGRLLGLHEKIALVPIGEFVPFLHLLPDGLKARIGAAVDQRYGLVLHEPGDYRPPLETAAGVPFGAMLCYDNAFPGVARTLVARGARFLAVLSNEAWYEGGNELAQLEAMSVCRALEVATPIVRCTMDGSTVAIDAHGSVISRLPYGVPGPAEPAVLEVAVVPAAGALPPLAWLHALACWVAALSAVPVAWHVLATWARLLRARRGVTRPATSPSVP